MADHSVKDEPKRSADLTSNPFASQSFSFSDDAPVNNSEPLWKLCDQRSRVQQVKINEEAAEHARKYLQDVEKVLNGHRDEVHSCDTRLKEIGMSSANPPVLSGMFLAMHIR
jgi:hypothetical protein